MAKKLEPWQKRIRAHIKAHEIKSEDIAATLNVEEATVRHWLNGTRRIKLDDLLRLCAAVRIDPAIALFGGPALSEAQYAALRDLAQPKVTPTPARPARPAMPRPKGRSGNGEGEPIA